MHMALPLGLRFMSFNLRYDSQPDNTTVRQTIDNLPDPLIPRSSYYNRTTERPWSERRVAVANEIRFNRVDVIGFQEALVRQIDDLQELLGPEWDHRGVGRDDGDMAGEFSPIFWKKSILNLVDWDTFWLSHTPFIPGSKFPGAGSVRICTVAHFHCDAGKLKVLVTHWDERSDAQRQLAASLILHRANYEALQSLGPVILLGDFNSPSSSPGNSGYEIITGSRPRVAIDPTFSEKYPIPEHSPQFFMIDLVGQAPREFVSGNHATYTGFSKANDSSVFSRVDFIMGGSNRGWDVKAYRVGQSLDDDGMHKSDHRPVYSDIMI